MSWFSNQWNRFANQFDGDDESRQPITRLEIVWGRERLLVPVNEQHYGQATLRNLKSIVSQQTSVPLEQVKLIMGGLVLKEEKATLASFGIRNGSRLVLVGTQGGVPVRGDMPGAKTSVMGEAAAEGSGVAGQNQQHYTSKGEELARRRKEREEDVSEQGLTARIEETLSDVRTNLAPEVEEFDKLSQQQQQSTSAMPPASVSSLSSSSSPPPFEAQSKQQRKLSELLLRSLLALDGIHVNTDETRKRRKEAVKEIQGLLDRVDAAWTRIKEQQQQHGNANTTNSSSNHTAAL